MVAASMVLSGCADNTAVEEETPVLELGYVQWACASANSHMLKVLIEDKFDVDVNLVDMEAGLMWQGVATGDLDFMVTAWLPTTHAAYYEELKDDVVDLGPLYEGAAIGLVVPQYVDINSIEELNANADKFSGQIIGIDAGAGIMGACTQAIEDYDLDLELLPSSGAAMTAELKTAYANEEWVVVTGWAPHWMFGSFDLKFLEDPNGSFGGKETINPITRLGFATDYPEINEFLDNYFLTSDQFGGLIETMEEYDDDFEAASVWIDLNQDLVNGWFE
jgi:glycine betaine/proline transport system substrate-binding protein